MPQTFELSKHKDHMLGTTITAANIPQSWFTNLEKKLADLHLYLKHQREHLSSSELLNEHQAFVHATLLALDELKKVDKIKVIDGK